MISFRVKVASVVPQYSICQMHFKLQSFMSVFKRGKLSYDLLVLY